ncbi:MAG: helix-turn-helix domain-containing protein [Clostridia bacterium]|nr:helix-turn-helix domain-containing protein [Clostridia bacterium]
MGRIIKALSGLLRALFDRVNHCGIMLGLRGREKMSKMLTLREVSESLGLHINTIRNYVKQGKLKAVLFGRVYRVEEKDVMRVRRQGVKK